MILKTAQSVFSDSGEQVLVMRGMEFKRSSRSCSRARRNMLMYSFTNRNDAIKIILNNNANTLELYPQS